MMFVRINEHKLFSYDIVINGIKFANREDKEKYFGKNYQIEYQKIRMCSETINMRTERWLNSDGSAKENFFSIIDH